MKQPSQKAKIQNENWLIQRDGLDCLFCRKPIPRNVKHIHDHLNNNRKDNRLENFVRAHYSCNTAKAYNTDYDLIAQQKLKENEQSLFIPVENNELEETSTEIKISKNSFDITEQYITEKILTDNSITWHDALYGSNYQCKKKTGYGSVQCVRNYLYTLTSPEAPFMVVKDKNKQKAIQRRIGN